jgi:hypothetical protein
MKRETVRYTATLPLTYVDELKKMAEEKVIPSVNFAINEALEEYMKNLKASRYESLMKEAGRDKVFLARTKSCTVDFEAVDAQYPTTA